MRPLLYFSKLLYFWFFSYAVDNCMPLSSKSSLKLSIHLFLCLPLLLSPLTYPCISSLFPSILSHPNHSSLLLLIFSITTFSALLILSLLLLPLILLNHAISATSSLLSSSFVSVQHTNPYINTGSTRPSRTSL